MLAEERFALILNLLAEKRTATVQELCEALNASESTIRRDLTELARQGRLNKVPGGGARLPVLTYMEPLGREALRSILTQPKNAIIKQYEKLFEMDGVKLVFDDEVLDYIVDKAIEYRLGARGLRSICEAIMMDTMFDIPSSGERRFEVTLPYAREKFEKKKFLALKQVG